MDDEEVGEGQSIKGVYSVSDDIEQLTCRMTINRHLRCGAHQNSLQGSGGGTSGRGMAFCLGRPGSNPRVDFGFFQFRIAVNLL